MRRAKIVATIGPASDSKQVLESLIKAGMNVARLNFSHGTHEQHQARVAAIRAAAKELGVPVGILQDLQGPKIRVGKLVTPLQLSVGENVCLFATQDDSPQTEYQLIPVDFRELFDSVHPGDRLLLDDGRVALELGNLDRAQSKFQALLTDPALGAQAKVLLAKAQMMAGHPNEARTLLGAGPYQSGLAYSVVAASHMADGDLDAADGVLATYPLVDIERVIQVNLVGAIVCSQEFIRQWKQVSSDLTALDHSDAESVSSLGGTANVKAQKLMKLGNKSKK